MERSKQCARCTVTKPWSAFRPRSDSPYGTPRAYCRDCARAINAEHKRASYHRNIETERARMRAEYWDRKRNDPEGYAIRRAYFRDYRRKQRGTSPDGYRVSQIMRDVELGPAANLAAAPFGAWLRGLGMRPGEISQTTGIDDTLVSRLIADPPKQPYVSVDTVDRACAALGGDLGALYPEWACTA